MFYASHTRRGTCSKRPTAVGEPPHSSPARRSSKPIGNAANGMYSARITRVPPENTECVFWFSKTNWGLIHHPHQWTTPPPAASSVLLSERDFKYHQTLSPSASSSLLHFPLSHLSQRKLVFPQKKKLYLLQENLEVGGSAPFQFFNHTVQLPRVVFAGSSWKCPPSHFYIAYDWIAEEGGFHHSHKPQGSPWHLASGKAIAILWLNGVVHLD